MARPTPPRRMPAIDGENHPRRIPRTVRGQKRHEVADLAGMGGAAERHALLEFPVAVLVAELVFRARLHQRDVAVGADRAGIDADHADVVGQALAAERAGKRHQRRVAGAAADIIGVEFFTGGADVVDDDAMAARLHLRVDGAGEVDVAEHFQLPGVTPGRLVDLVDRAAGNIAGIVDENVDVGGVLRQPGEVLRIAQVDDMRRGVDLVRPPQPFGQRLQRIAAAGREHEVAAFLGEGFGGGRADALRCARNQDALAAQMQIHGVSRVMGGRWKRGSVGPES